MLTFPLSSLTKVRLVSNFSFPLFQTSHFNLGRNGKPMLRCGMCDFMSEEGKDFEDHWETHNHTPKEQVQCVFPDCDFSTEHRSQLLTHQV